MTLAQPEEAVLRSRDAITETNSDDWPEFELTNVHIRAASEEDVDVETSLLVASEHYPVIVTGDLQSPAKHLAHLVLQSSRSVRIELAAVRSFAYGQFSDGSVALWAAGKAGWFALKPSRGYRPFFNEMVEAVKTLYFIVDAYRDVADGGSARGSQYNAKGIFEKYALDHLDNAEDTEAAADHIYAHRDFLLASMIAGKENIKWRQNSLYLHLQRKFPDDYRRIMKRLAGPDRPTPSTDFSSSRRESLDTSVSEGRKRKRGRPSNDVRANESVRAASTTSSRSARPSVSRRTTRQSLYPSESMSRTATPTARSRSTPEDTDTGSDVLEGRYARKGKSALRLQSSRSRKGPAITQSAPMDEEDSADETVPSALHQRTEVDKKMGRKRRGDEEDEGIDIPESPFAEDDTEPGAEHSTESLPLRLNHTLDPVQENTWVCALDGCRHKVYAADLPASQALIREHYALHAYDDDERVQLVKKLQAPSLPVQHLMDRVRSQAKLDGFPGSKVAGTRYPMNNPGIKAGAVRRY